jgi:asparagine synthase (glutamine-hydrolysing)
VCGIAGYTHWNRAFDPGRIRKVTLTLLHRGPDQQGVYQSATVSLGATRLKIIDLEGGDQPVTTGDGAVVVYNGEIYNYAALRRELEQLGHRFHSHSDTEVLLRAFLQWDTACLRACGACSPQPSGWSATVASCSCGTGWESSRFTTVAAAAICTSARN